MHIVLAANAEADQPWVADTTAALAKQTGASVAVVSVDELETQALAPMPRSVYVERAEHAARTAAERLAAAGVDVTHAVRSGAALGAILDFAEEQRADLVVVGSSTRRGISERLLGSVPLALIEKSPRPVLVVTQPATA